MNPLATLEQQAVDLARSGNFGADAQRVNAEITRLAPANLSAWTRLGRCCLELGQLDEATAAFDAALQINPQNTIARNLLLEVTRRRTALTAPPATPRRRAPAARRGERTPAVPAAAGFGRREFTALGTLAAPVAADAIGRQFEALFLSLNERPFAQRIVEARNRAGQAGSWLFRRGSFHPGRDGHVYVFHHGGRWEPQINLGLQAAPQFGRDALRAGIGFAFGRQDEPDGAAGLERAVKYFEQFQQLLASGWRELLTDWMRAGAGFVQHGGHPPATDLLPSKALEWLASVRDPREAGWIFVGRWLFGDRPSDAEVLADAGRLIPWAEQAFTELLPLWTSTYRGR